MADTANTKNAIDKDKSPFPEYLDFKALRSEGIEYLGKLAGNIWTDHNVHDPGITILEMLCYAILDLGYRTNLPAIDIFARNPEDHSADSNFFTPAQILSCNPVTINDYRRLLIDIEGIRNAWLVPASDIKDFCRHQVRPPRDNENVILREDTGARTEGCIEFLNGLYHVYIDLEKNVEEEFKNDPGAKKDYLDMIIRNVREILMKHRNLCEDIEDIFFLCKIPVGICADIELNQQADVEKTYLETVKALREFLTPSPRFYTLQELLAKKKSMEEIFAGRALDLKSSHGFVDAEELEELKLRKEIHLSDLYTVIQAVAGVQSVRNLAFRLSASGTGSTNWSLGIPKDHVPEFSVAYSGFRFMRNGVPVATDLKKFDSLLNINFSHNGKILHQHPSPYLDTEVPKGVYHKDLSVYYSIQNEFPRVYGIQEGGLPDTSSDLRKSQALQLKGYLLFFDQLLANYMAQLGAMRSLFSTSTTQDDQDQHTYFINQLTSVPEIEKLLRFQSGNNTSASELGGQGSFQVIPVDRKEFDKLKEENKLRYLNLDAISSDLWKETPPLIRRKVFKTLNEQDITISQVKNDLYFGGIRTETVVKADDCVYYYLVPSSGSVILLSSRYFKDEKTALRAAASVTYIGTLDENYRSLVTNSGDFSFNIELNLDSFSKYLQLIAEDKALFQERRQKFLNHLLSRFAEKFTDYALLSFRSMSDDRKALVNESNIRSTERFLRNYGDLSGNRGKAYDYLRKQWNNDNISGFEKRVRAITGMEHWKRTSLCNFTVDTYDEQYHVILTVSGKELFSLNEVFESREDARLAAQEIFQSLKDRSRYSTDRIEHENTVAVQIRLDHYSPAILGLRLDSAEDANRLINNLQGQFNPMAERQPIISQYIYRIRLQNTKNITLRTSKDFFKGEADAKGLTGKFIDLINDPNPWDITAGITQPERLYHSKFNPSQNDFINVGAFKIDINDTIIGKPDRFTYDILDKNNSFKFNAIGDFESLALATSHSQDLLACMLYDENYLIHEEKNRHVIYITNSGTDLAVYYTGFSDKTTAGEEMGRIQAFVKQHLYNLVVSEIPYRWRFTYSLGYEPSEKFSFESDEEFPAPDDAIAAAGEFFNAAATLTLKESKQELKLVPGKPGASGVRFLLDETRDHAAVKKTVNELLQFQKEIGKLASEGPDAFEASIRVDEKSRQGRYVYRLIDKDRVPAFFSERYQSDDEAMAARRNLAKIRCREYRYLEICLGGKDIINKRKEESTNRTWYHYLVRCRNRFTSSGSELILFESTLGYATEQEAEKAFITQYLFVLAWARDASQYGKKISMTENPIYATDNCIKSDSVVFIPQNTLNTVGTYTDDSIRKIQAIANSYPIRPVEFQSDEFYELFPCEQRQPKVSGKKCKDEKKTYVFYFRIDLPLADSDNVGYWQSSVYYEKTEEARKDFYFFIILLCYPGNLYVDCDLCDNKPGRTLRIFIREVLAESVKRFPSEEAAWGAEGVERLICVSQSESSFHTFRRKDCCYSFFIACGSSLVYHPCRYDLPEKRDRVSNNLYMALTDYNKGNAYKYQQTEKGILLTDGQGKIFAILPASKKTEVFDLVAGVVNVVRDSSGSYEKGDDSVLLRDARQQIIAQSVGGPYEIVEWQTRLESFAYFFPVVITGAGTQEEKYCIEIKLPGFHTQPQDRQVDEPPCGCGEKTPVDDPACYIAWKGSCCYRSLREAQTALLVTMRLLSEYENYRPVMGCACHDFGVALYYSNDPVAGVRSVDTHVPSWLTTGEMVAFNPQCYSNPEMDCAAVERAWKLINAEGLHVVEHILLRPRCEGDCRCRLQFSDCGNKIGCQEFEWQETSDDPCAEKPLICFKPGADPYSCIATVVLPSWTARFRDPDNRALLENILYREAPAHILLRIFWLAPHDFCCFEQKHKAWNRWLAREKSCLEFDPCDLIQFLFNRSYASLADCRPCSTCADDPGRASSCFEEIEDEKDKNIRYLNQINELFCWRLWNEREYTFSPCRETVHQPWLSASDGITGLAIEKKSAKKMMSPPEVKNIERAEKAAVTVSEKLKSPEAKQIPPSGVSQKSKHQAVNSRLSRYRKEVDEVLKKSNSHVTAGKVQLFLKDPAPTIERISSLLQEIVKKPRGKTAGSLKKEQVFKLVECSVCYYLDKICFNGKDMERITALKSVLAKLRKKGIKTETIFRHWEPEEIKLHEPDLDIGIVRRLLTTKN